MFLCGVTEDITVKIRAGDLVKKAASICGGGGGGRPDFAQAGGKEVAKIDRAVSEIKKIIAGMG